MADNHKNVVLVGSGNVATHLGMALQKSGYKVVQVFSRTESSASVLARQLGTSYTVSLAELCPDAGLYIVSVTDAVLQSLLPDIVKGREKSLFVHTAGSVPMDIWKGVTERYGVLYPMQTFSKQRSVDFGKVSFFVEANRTEDLKMLMQMASSLGSHVYEATSEQRMSLHVAAVFACNFANHMYAISARLLEKYGMPFEAMLPLIEETARKVHELSPKEAQTGPAIRRDENVMNKHMDLLSEMPELCELYKRISKSIQNI